jgi:hypothetical protein
MFYACSLLSIDKFPRFDGKGERFKNYEGLAGGVRNDAAEIFDIFPNTTGGVASAQQCAGDNQQ